MKTMQTSIQIHAPKEQVWHVMLDDATYREWTAAFMPGSYFKGDWSKGSKMLFLGPNPEGAGEGGMVSMVEENIPYESLWLKHLGIVADDVEDTTSEQAKPWATSTERYAFREQEDGTKVEVTMEIPDEYLETFLQMWKDGLLRLKELVESKTV